jgi:hypothetical protein
MNDGANVLPCSIFSAADCASVHLLVLADMADCLRIPSLGDKRD